MRVQLAQQTPPAVPLAVRAAHGRMVADGPVSRGGEEGSKRKHPGKGGNSPAVVGRTCLHRCFAPGKVPFRAPPKGATMSDSDVSTMIESLVREEHELWERESAGDATDADRRRLGEIKVQLDQYW